MAPIREGDFTFVTNNAKDLRRLHALEEVHAGLVILIPNVPPAVQRELVDAAGHFTSGSHAVPALLIQKAISPTFPAWNTRAYGLGR